MSEPRHKLIWRSRRMTSELELTLTHLIDRWTKGSQSGEKRIALSKLSPELSYTKARPKNTAARLIGGGICLGAAAVFFFSVIQEKVPLLSLFFCLLAIWLIVLGLLRGLRLESWTIIHRESGKRFAWFRHEDCSEQERKEFEVAFKQMVSRGNQQPPARDSSKAADVLTGTREE